jgi:hypothetical protein
VLVVVPNHTLAAKQISLYCPEAKIAIDSLFEEDSQGIFVCIFSDLLTGRSLPEGTILLIDEIDSFLFDFKA